MSDTPKLPSWADYLPYETRNPDTDTRRRLKILTSLPPKALSERQIARLTHRNRHWALQFRSTPNAQPLIDLTLEEAIALHRAIGPNNISTPFIMDQLRRYTSAQIQRLWGFTTQQTKAAITRAKKGKSTWMTSSSSTMLTPRL